MKRLRLYDFRASRLPRLIGTCADNLPVLAEAVNTAQLRLLYARETGDEGWYGTFAEVAFNISRSTPYITLPREIARLEAINICNRPVNIQNQFYEYMAFGNGRLPKTFPCNDLMLQSYSRNNAVTFTEKSTTPQLMRAYATDSQDVGKRILFQGTDQNGNDIYSQDTVGQNSGEFVVLSSPFATSLNQFLTLTGIQKDVTVGVVRIYQVDPTTGEEVLLLTMQPTEQTASYRRYYFNQLPVNCCNVPSTESTDVQVTAIVKMEMIPVVYDTDYTLLQNMEAILEEAQSIRYSEIDSPGAKQMAAERHKQAIFMLNGELGHYLGTKSPAINVRPFGSARLERVRIGMQ